MHSSLLHIFNQITPLEQEETELITARFIPMQISKGDFYLRTGEINRHVGFITKGLVRYFVYKDGEESTFGFTPENDFIADYQSFTGKKPTQQNIQAIEDCELLVINYDDTQHIFNTTKNGNLLGRIILEHRFDLMVTQMLSIYMHDPEERYINFLENYEDILQRIPQYMIASFVGVKAPSLSRIRKRVHDRIS